MPRHPARSARRTLPAALALALTPGLVALAPPAGAVVPTGVTTATVRAATADQAPSTTGGTRIRPFAIASKNADEGGALVKGKLKFRAWNEVKVAGTVNDVCPGDDKWGMTYIEVHYRGTNGPATVAYDQGGCSSAVERFSHRFLTRRAIVRVKVEACTRVTNPGLVSRDDCRARNFRNPKVAR